MQTCTTCGLAYEPVTGEEHNGIHLHTRRLTPAEAEAFRAYAVDLDKQAAELLRLPYDPRAGDEPYEPLDITSATMDALQ